MPSVQPGFSSRSSIGPRFILASSLTLLLAAGCSGKSDAPPRFAVSGKVDFAGTAVPFGEIVFQPDSDKGNKGPGARGVIENGAYKIEAATGPIGGAHIVRITGLDGKPAAGAAPPPPATGAAPAASAPATGLPLFKEYKTTVDLPKQATTKDFSVPKK